MEGGNTELLYKKNVEILQILEISLIAPLSFSMKIKCSWLFKEH